MLQDSRNVLANLVFLTPATVTNFLFGRDVVFVSLDWKTGKVQLTSATTPSFPRAHALLAPMGITDASLSSINPSDPSGS